MAHARPVERGTRRAGTSPSKWRIRVCSGRASSRNNSSTATTRAWPSSSGNRTCRHVGGTSRQTERQPPLALSLDSGQPQIMGVFEHRQAFAAIELHGEFGAEVVEAFVALQGGEDLLGQVTCVEQHLPINPGARAEHQVAHIVARRVRWAEARGEQTARSTLPAHRRCRESAGWRGWSPRSLNCRNAARASATALACAR